MTHFAKLDENNVVIFVTKGRQEDEDREAEISSQTGHTYKRTSYNTRGGTHYDPLTGEESKDQSKAYRKNYAGLGYTYDPSRDAFIAPKPYASWVLDEKTCLWSAPIPEPSDSGSKDDDNKFIKYRWDEDAYQSDNTKGWERKKI